MQEWPEWFAVADAWIPVHFRQGIESEVKRVSAEAVRVSCCDQSPDAARVAGRYCMTSPPGRKFRAARIALAVLLILVTGFWGVVITFSDSPASWSMLALAAYIAAWHVPSAMVIGLLVPHKWWLGVAAGWGALLMLSFTLPVIALSLIVVMVGAAYVGGAIGNRVTNTRRGQT